MTARKSKTTDVVPEIVEPEPGDETTGATIDDETRPPAPETRVGVEIDPQLAAALESIAAATESPFAVDRAYKAAWFAMRGDNDRPEREVERRLGEAQRIAFERFVTTRPAKRSRSDKPATPKGEFKPFVQSVLDYMTQHYAEHGAAAGLRVKDIADGMSKHAGTVTHAVRELVEARRLRPMPNESKRYTLFANRAENVPVEISSTTGERAATATPASTPTKSTTKSSTKSKTAASAAA